MLKKFQASLIPQKPRKSSMTFWSKKDPMQLYKKDDLVDSVVNPPYKVEFGLRSDKRDYNHAPWQVLAVRARMYMAKKEAAEAAEPSHPTEEEEEMEKHELTVEPFRWVPDVGWVLIEQPIEGVIYEELDGFMPGDLSTSRPLYSLKEEWKNTVWYQAVIHEQAKLARANKAAEPKMPFTVFSVEEKKWEF
nr:hypothetical protein BaRGS_006671 [Batillaria attramentaria]